VNEALEATLRDLMLRYQQGDAQAFDELYACLAPPLRRYLIARSRQAPADDLLQDTFLQIHRSRRSYDPARPVRPWAFAIARYVHLMSLRTKRRKDRPSVPLDDAPELPVPPEVEGLASRDELSRVLARLQPEALETVLLHHVWGFSFEEIGKMVGMSAGAARVRSSRALSKLRKLLRRP
jgi:RNA polymerase sigma-70 factor (ECF subfamily)